MSELDPKTRSLLKLARAAEDPTFADRARVRKRLAGVLGTTLAAGSAATAVGRGLDSGTHFATPSIPAAAKATLFGFVKGGLFQASLWIAAVAALAGGSALVFGVRDSIWPSAPIDQAAPVTAPRAPEPKPKPAAPRNDAPSERAAEAPNAVEAPALDAPGAAQEKAADGAKAPAEAGAAQRQALAPQPVLPLRPLSLAEEARELGAVHAALRDGRASLALSRLDSMDRRRGGALRQERIAARVLALCELGRVHEAESAARRFRALAPESPLLSRLSGSCAHAALDSE